MLFLVQCLFIYNIFMINDHDSVTKNNNIMIRYLCCFKKNQKNLNLYCVIKLVVELVYL